VRDVGEVRGSSVVRLTKNRSWLSAPRSLRATRAGWCFIGIIFGVGFAALNTGNNLLYLVLALMLSFLVLSGLLSETSLRGIRIERSLPRELFAGHPNRVVLNIHNTLRKNTSFAITIEDQIDSSNGFEVAGRVFALRIPAQSRVTASYLFEPKLRGDCHFSGFRVSTRFPFGLFVKSRQLDCIEDCIVYPHVSRVAIQPERSSERSESNRGTTLSPDGDEIAGVRDFVAGDSQRRVHWRSTLRAGRLLVGEREAISHRELEVHLHWPSQSHASVVEERIERAASEIVTHLDAGIRVSLMTPTMHYRSGAGLAHRADLLTFLARLDAETERPA
jgi:uncharacterized protein (DUF58 family)